MAAIPRNHPRMLPVVGTAIAIIVVTLLTNRLATVQGQRRQQLAPQATVGTAGANSMPAAKERVRYHATIENWRRYRAIKAAD